jgi:hypothetical protein
MYAGPFHSCDGDVVFLSGAALETAQSVLYVNEQKVGPAGFISIRKQ